MNRCKTCKHWVKDEYDMVLPSYGRDKSLFVIQGNESRDWEHPSDEDDRKLIPARMCSHEKVVFYEAMPPSGVTLTDGSQYQATMYTHEDYGCVLHEPETGVSNG